MYGVSRMMRRSLQNQGFWSWGEFFDHTGFRLAHALVSDSFNDHIRSIKYSHSEQEDKLSEHSALVLDVENFA